MDLESSEENVLLKSMPYGLLQRNGWWLNHWDFGFSFSTDGAIWYFVLCLHLFVSRGTHFAFSFYDILLKSSAENKEYDVI